MSKKCPLSITERCLFIISFIALFLLMISVLTIKEKHTFGDHIACQTITDKNHCKNHTECTWKSNWLFGGSCRNK